VAEDNPVNQRVLSELIARRGHVAVLAGDGEAAVHRFREGRFDLVLMDVQMPVMDGLQALASIRELEGERAEKTPIVAITAHAMKGDRERCLRAGFDGYLSKPIRAPELDALIGAAAREEGPAAVPSPSLFDRAVALEQAGGDEGLLLELTRMVLDRGPEQLEHAREALDVGDGPGAARSLHTLKGSVGLCLARHSLSPLEELEGLCRGGRLDEARCHLPAIRTTLAALFDEIRRDVEPDGPAAPALS
jgi:CheY-like chemotaxis protein